MLKIIHTSDWHLGKRLERFSRHEEQVAFLEELNVIAEEQQADVILVAGDLFDTFNPPAESVDLFYRSLKKLAKNGLRPVIAIAGNHDMPERIEAPDPLARECGIIFAGFPETEILPFSLQPGFSITKAAPGFLELSIPGKPLLRLLLTPYANEIRLRKGLNPDNNEEELRALLTEHWKNLAEKYCDPAGVNVLMAHLLLMPEGGTAPEEPEDERPINHIGGAQAIFTSSIPSSIQYVALGHLHRKQVISAEPCPVMYSGSPLSYSFSEAGQEKFVLMVNLQPGQAANIEAIQLKSGRKLERKRFLTPDEAEAWLLANPLSLVELTLVSDTFLSGADRRRLTDLHDGIIIIIPEISGSGATEKPDPVQGPQQKSMPELFSDFFKVRKGQEPDQALIQLFTEINAEEDEL